jgi:hypothetical protein
MNIREVRNPRQTPNKRLTSYRHHRESTAPSR